MGDLLERKRRSVVLLPLVLAFFLTLCIKRSVVSSLEYSKDRPASNLTLEEIQEFLKTINKPAVVTFERSGDIIDCVDMYKQPAFDNPLLQNHRIQENPCLMPKMENVNGENNVSSSMNEDRKRMNEVFQQWYQNMTSCPKGTVPIRRTTVDDVLRAGSISALGKKKSNAFAPNNIRTYHEYAVGYTTPVVPVLGAAADINVWNPYVERNLEMSVAQIWVAAGSFEGADLNTIEAGWQVSPMEYGDRRTRLFGYWTRDGYGSTGCYNAGCGFVQIDPTIHLGNDITPLSIYAGPQREIYLTIYKDICNGNWWLRMGESTVVGYWPMSLFTHLSTGGATKVHWGGEIVNLNFGSRHSTTHMGSGHFAWEGFKKAAYFRSLGLVLVDGIIPPLSLSTQTDNGECYDVSIGNNRNWGLHFFYGGPGLGPRCP